MVEPKKVKNETKSFNKAGKEGEGQGKKEHAGI